MEDLERIASIKFDLGLQFHLLILSISGIMQTSLGNIPMKRKCYQYHLLLLVATAGCSNSNDSVLERLDLKNQAAIEANTAMVDHLTDPTEMQQLLGQAQATILEKGERLRNGQAVDDLDNKTKEMLSAVKAITDRTESLGKTLSMAVIDYYSFMASVSETCGNDELDVSVIDNIIPARSFVDSDGKTPEQLFWEVKWAYDKELETDMDTAECDAAVERINLGKAILENRLT